LVPALLAAVVLLLGAGDDARVNRLGHQIMCVCSCNQILLECNHVGCPYSSHMRDELVAAVARGADDSGVLQWFVQTYGTTVLVVPTTTGFNQVAWIMPYLALVLGIVLVALLVWVWKGRPALAGAGTAAAVPGGELERFRDQVHRETEI